MRLPFGFISPLSCGFLARLCATALAVALAGSAAAIQPQRWVHSTEADFEPGEAEGVVVTNLGDLRLARAAEPLGELPEDVTIVYDVATIGGATYVAAGPEGRLLKLADGEVTEVATLENEQVFSIAAYGPTLLVGVSGENTRVARLVDSGLETLVELPEERYIWDLLPTRQGDAAGDADSFNALLIATGVEGRVYRVLESDPEEAEVLLDTAQANVLCLAAGPDGLVYAGTDTDGLIYRIESDGTAYVVYDAAEPEVGALVVTSDGTLYAGTADAEQARPGRLEEAGDESGRPEVPTTPDGAGADEVPDPPDDLPVEPDPQPLQGGDAEAGDAGAEGEPAGPAEPENSPGPMPDAAAAVEESEPTPDQADEADAEPAEDAAAAVPTEPTPEQYDAVRAELRKRLLAARESGTIGQGSNPAGDTSGGRPTRNAAPSAAAAAPKSGNAVYRIDPRGFVSEVFRDSVMVLSLAERADGKLLVGTGSEGQLYLVDPSAGETGVLTDLESQQLLALDVQQDGVLIGGSNPAALLRLSADTADRGTYTSVPLDAGQVSLWGVFRVTADLPGQATLTVQTRSGNVADPEIAAWSEWTKPTTLRREDGASPLQPLQAEVQAPPARYLQYRLVLENGDASGEDSISVGKVELAYVVPNLRPAIASVTAAYPPATDPDQPPNPNINISWEATDDNGDRLLFDLALRPAGGDTWITLADDLTETSYEWQTQRVPDGRYHLRVTATDRLDNPGDMALTAGRLVDPVTIDNTPPDAEDVELSVEGDRVSLGGVAVDELSPIWGVAYRVDDDERYSPILADDLIYDSTTEAWSTIISDLAPGGHTVTVRLLDTRGNAALVSKLFEIPQND